ncbi:MAG: ThiF family adenylyltransferase [Dehalococcoidia bacterium]
MMQRLSVAMSGATQQSLCAHLVRTDGQEDLCFALWRPSSGRERKSALLQEPVLPLPGERTLHGNASFQPDYLLRAAGEAAARGAGLAFLHSHPGGRGWQGMSPPDRAAEERIANLARETTGYPLVGLTLAGGDGSWSARVWNRGAGLGIALTDCATVRSLDAGLRVSFNDDVLPAPAARETQVRTEDAWGSGTQSTIARLSVLVVGVGSVGMMVVDALARMGVGCIGVMDFDTVELVNLDRLRYATRTDARLLRSKAFVARRLLAEASTAWRPRHEVYEVSVCEPEAMARLLDFDVVFSCVDRPWPRHVLNTIAYADLIPVIDGGLLVERNRNGDLANAYWRSSVVGPGRPCLACQGQYEPGFVQVERDGSLDDPTYIANLPPGSALRARQNVAALSASVAAAQLEQFVALVARPSGLGDPGPLRWSLRDHCVTREDIECSSQCVHQESASVGDGRFDPTGRHRAAEKAREERRAMSLGLRLARRTDDVLWQLQQRLAR